MAERGMKMKQQSFISRVLNPKYIMVYATIGVFLAIYLFGALMYGDIGFTTIRNVPEYVY